MTGSARCSNASLITQRRSAVIKRLGVVLVLLLAVVTLADAQPKPVRPFTFILDF